MHQIDIVEAKAHLSDFIEVALGGEDIIIAQDDKPILKLICVLPKKKQRKAGSAKGLITISGEFDAPLEDFREYM